MSVAISGGRERVLSGFCKLTEVLRSDARMGSWAWGLVSNEVIRFLWEGSDPAGIPGYLRGCSTAAVVNFTAFTEKDRASLYTNRLVPVYTLTATTLGTCGGMDIAEQELIAKAQAGDGEAFREVVKRYQQAVYRLAYRFLLHHDDAEDVVQETFVRAYLKLHTFDRRRGFRAWLYTIAVHECRRVARHRIRWAAVEPLDEGIPDPAWASSPEQAYARRDLAREVRRAVLRLSLRQRAALILMEVEGLSSEEAGQIIGCSPATARTHLHRAKERLRQELWEYVVLGASPEGENNVVVP
jgi:RNA polymerase sigma-70 factor (ECF subfamily)